MEKLYERSQTLKKNPTGYCPGCFHGVAMKIICEIIDEMKMQDNTTTVLPIGCSSMGCFTIDTDMVIALHGRAPAVATGIKRCSPERLVYAYQGDGDLAAIGFSEIMYAANRGENFTVIFVNNSIYGMTGGQMAPTTLVGQKATTSQKGRNPENKEGYPMHMSELISQLKAPVYVERCALNSPQNILKAKKAIRKGFEIQLSGKGFSFIELLSNCPTNWGMSPEETLKWMEENTMKEVPIGVYKDISEEVK